jgi:hypothetical protein
MSQSEINSRCPSSNLNISGVEYGHYYDAFLKKVKGTSMGSYEAQSLDPCPTLLNRYLPNFVF